MRRSLLAATLALLPLPMLAEPLTERPGWRLIDTDTPYAELVDAVKLAIPAHGLNVVTEAGPTAAAAALGTTLPGNRVIGAFHARYAIRVLPLSTAAMIEAPIRLYVTEDADGTATLSWKTPSHVFAPYMDDGGDALAGIAAELDAVFEAIAADATK
ncbi:DUF302 domain-containing protein [Fertoebacter nigrum]|uniref:DUF302 domain-containing protein n=1 Tax=Fertoeibacter niger TaxID=2656921 RepID=A0A8X8KMC9_9RHOB|nr:DUF302 domain-containing protein [Fertoeibacter niger]NUB43790.1 DUF302 domain-containing protein [Fertoeibacter niger]